MLPETILSYSLVLFFIVVACLFLYALTRSSSVPRRSLVLEQAADRRRSSAKQNSPADGIFFNDVVQVVAGFYSDLICRVEEPLKDGKYLLKVSMPWGVRIGEAALPPYIVAHRDQINVINPHRVEYAEAES